MSEPVSHATLEDCVPLFDGCGAVFLVEVAQKEDGTSLALATEPKLLLLIGDVPGLARLADAIHQELGELVLAGWAGVLAEESHLDDPTVKVGVSAAAAERQVDRNGGQRSTGSVVVGLTARRPTAEGVGTAGEGPIGGPSMEGFLGLPSGLTSLGRQARLTTVPFG
jgi:hypothetical protein